MAGIRRTAAVILTVITVVAILFSLFVIVRENDHNCTGDNCPVCALIHFCRETLKALSATLLIALFALAVPCFVSPAKSVRRSLSFIETPISLKVKLLN